MGNHAKYVIVPGFMGSEVAIIFNATMDHSTFAHMNPVSAGFIYFGEDPYDIACGGKSVSLNGLKSRGEADAVLVKLALNNLDRY